MRGEILIPSAGANSSAQGMSAPGTFSTLGAAPWRLLAVLFVSSRVTVWLAGYLGGRAFGVGETDQVYLCRHDCFWYLEIATNGYQQVPAGVPTGSANWAFLPLYPLLVRALAGITAIDPLIAGLLVSNLAFALALLVFYFYCRDSGGFDRRGALYASTVLCYSPGTIYFMSPYTESLFLLLSLLTFHFAARERWVYAGVSAALLSATRAVGILAGPALLLIALQKHGWRDLLRSEIRCPRVLLAIALAPMGLAAFMAHLHLLMGDALAFQHVQIAWGREFSNPLNVLWIGLQNPSHLHFWYALVTIAALGLGLFGVLRRRYAESFFLVASVSIPLSSFLFSMPRYVFSLFPFYTLLALLAARDEARQSVLLGVSVAVACVYAIAWALDRGFVC